MLLFKHYTKNDTFPREEFSLEKRGKIVTVEQEEWGWLSPNILAKKKETVKQPPALTAKKNIC